VQTHTLIIPVYNVSGYVGVCLSSVLASSALVDLEIIIIDDGSTDDSSGQVAAWIERYQPPRTLFVRQVNQGLSAVRNLGVSLARGDYVGFLDSDDLLTAGSMRKLLDYAKRNQCDVVLGQSLIFDSKSHEVTSFYDDWAWQRILSGGSCRTISRHEEPYLFFMEPNANYRLIRRSFYVDHGFSYPVGRLFEDPPVHFKMLALADRVGVVNVPYYWYRINRPGKITEERSRRRFDILAVAGETFDELIQMQVNSDAGGAMVYSLARIVWWCGTMTLPDQRLEFFKGACRLFQEKAPPLWIERFSRLHFPEEIQQIIVGSLMRNQAVRLFRLSLGQRTPLRSAIFLIQIGRKDLVLRKFKAIVTHRLKRS